MDHDAEDDEQTRAKDEDPGSAEAPVSGQPGGGLDRNDEPDDDSPEDEESESSDD